MSEEDPRLGDDRSTQAERESRNTWQNRRMARAAGWNDAQWEEFVDSGRMPLGKEDLYERERDPIY